MYGELYNIDYNDTFIHELNHYLIMYKTYSLHYIDKHVTVIEYENNLVTYNSPAHYLVITNSMIRIRISFIWHILTYYKIY